MRDIIARWSTLTIFKQFEVPNSEGGLPFLDLNGSVPGVYNGVWWSNFQLPSYSKLYASKQCIGICASSFPYQAVAHPGNGSSDLPAVSAIYEGSGIESFDLTAFASGCLQLGHGPFPMPVECIITLRGYWKRDATSSAAAQISLQYSPEATTNGGMGTMSAEMTVFTLPANFKGMRIVTFDAKLAANNGNEKGQSARAELHVDDVKFTAKNKLY